ncbi:hypothetical protein ACOCJ4_04350 [Knoellia sp. CPCC 206435]|uniref:hypothetical protein n=1 Tax=Knoellia terrae TaxID=3404797 RepID=UPI003B42853B
MAIGINAVCVVLLLVLVTFGFLHPFEIVFAFVLLLPPWLAVSALTALTGRWTGRERAMSTLLLPRVVVVMVIALWVLLALGAPLGFRLLPTFGVVAAVSWVLLVLGRSAR